MNQSLPDLIANKLINDFQEHNKLPTQSELTKLYFVSRSTIVKAIDILKDKGLVYTIQGSGVYFNSHKLPLYLEGIYSYDYQLIKLGIKIKNEVMKFSDINADTSLSEKLNINIGDPLIEIIRCKRDAYTNELLLVQHNYLLKSRFETLQKSQLENERLYVVLSKSFNLSLTDAVEELCLVHPSDEINNYLDNKHQKLIEIQRYSYERNLIVEYTKTYLITDKIKYTFSLNLDQPIF